MWGIRARYNRTVPTKGKVNLHKAGSVGGHMGKGILNPIQPKVMLNVRCGNGMLVIWYNSIMVITQNNNNEGGRRRKTKAEGRWVRIKHKACGNGK